MTAHAGVVESPLAGILAMNPTSPFWDPVAQLLSAEPPRGFPRWDPVGSLRDRVLAWKQRRSGGAMMLSSPPAAAVVSDDPLALGAPMLEGTAPGAGAPSSATVVARQGVRSYVGAEGTIVIEEAVYVEREPVIVS